MLLIMLAILDESLSILDRLPVLHTTSKPIKKYDFVRNKIIRIFKRESMKKPILHC